MDPACLGRLMYVNEDNLPPVIISKRNFVIGRARDCDLSLDNRKVSGHHCYLETLENGEVYLYDTSSNGTLLNTNRLTHGQHRILNSGDEFRIVFKEGSDVVGFKFHKSAVPDDENDHLNDTEDYDFELTTCATGSPEKAKPEVSRLVVDCSSTRSEVDTDKGVNAPNVEEKKEVADEIEDHLICSICQDILYKPISLQPCMHCFCSGCYSDWMDLSNECPQCRLKVERIAPNHMVGNLVDAFLKLHPEKQRDEDDIQELEAKNKISHDMLYIKKSVFEASSQLDTASSSSDSQEDALINFPFTAVRRKRAKATHHRKVCRQCPDQADTPPAKLLKKKKNDSSMSCNSKVVVAGCSQPSTSQSGTNQVTFVCAKNTHHVHCSCCFEYMPDRSRDRLKDPAVPPQTCELCPVPSLHYCHMYWGCKALSCTGCLAPLKDIVFGENCLDYVINGNQYESDVLKDFLTSRKMSWKELFLDCMTSLDSGEYVIDLSKFHQPPIRSTKTVIVNSDTPVCKFCAHKCLAQLAYQYRSYIPKQDLQDEVTRREDCYWGRNCRSQIKAHHARNFNHICEQTRFT